METFIDIHGLARVLDSFHPLCILGLLARSMQMDIRNEANTIRLEN